jgi:ADP-ribose pyrophosphatase YjhB (NUDIX family)
MNTQQQNYFPPRITVCVGAVVLRENKALFVRQAYGGLKGKWSLPWGFVDGKTSDGSPEPPDVAALRETQEEAGVIANVEGLLGVQNHSNDEGELRLYLLFLCHHVSGEPRPDNNETDQAAYFSLDEMANFNEPFDEFCAWVARRVLEGQYCVIPPQAENPYRPHVAFL